MLVCNGIVLITSLIADQKPDVLELETKRWQRTKRRGGWCVGGEIGEKRCSM